MINVVNGTNKLLCSDGTTQVGVGEKVIVVSKRDKTELQDTRTTITGTLMSWVPAFRRPITEAQLTGQSRYIAERATDSQGYAMYNSHQVEQGDIAEHITIRKENGCFVSIRGKRIVSLVKVSD